MRVPRSGPVWRSISPRAPPPAAHGLARFYAARPHVCYSAAERVAASRERRLQKSRLGPPNRLTLWTSAPSPPPGRRARRRRCARKFVLASHTAAARSRLVRCEHGPWRNCRRVTVRWGTDEGLEPRGEDQRRQHLRRRLPLAATMGSPQTGRGSLPRRPRSRRPTTRRRDTASCRPRQTSTTDSAAHEPRRRRPRGPEAAGGHTIPLNRSPR